MCIFLGEGPGLGQGPGLLGYGFKIPDSTIGVKIPTEHRAKFSSLGAIAAKK
jgi:hypothetical protein